MTPKHRRCCPRIFCLALLMLAAGPARGGEEQQKDAAFDRRWLDVYSEQASSFQLSFSAEPERMIHRESQPLLVYTNPVRGNQQHGVVYAWQTEGRPVCIGAVWSTQDPDGMPLRRIHHELHSLTPELLACSLDGAPMWESGQPGIEWQPLDDENPPAAGRALRMAQMRRIARTMTARLTGEENDLRLLPQPLYRWPEDVQGAVDGGVFTFVLGTDPELFVLIEARPQADGSDGWFVAFAQFTDRGVTVQRSGSEIWSCERAKPYQRTGRYYLMWKADAVPIADLPQEDPQS